MLNCTAIESANITWRFDDGNNGERRLPSIHYNDGHYSANTGSSIVRIKDVTQSRSGTYICVADNNGTRFPVTEDFTVTIQGIQCSAPSSGYHREAV